MAATRAAMEEGIVPGGGIALFNVALAGSGSPPSAEASVIIAKTLEAPLRAIVENSGESPDKIIGALKKEKRGTWTGFNAVVNKIEDLKDAGIVDPLKVVRAALVNAVSVAANYLTVGVAITNVPEKKHAPGGPPMGEEY